MHPASIALLSVAGLAAGAVNSVAGGGTVLTFPSLIAAGVSSLTANATNTVALVPGSISSAYGFRSELGRSRRFMLWMLLPSVIGGAAGAILVLHVGDAVFKKMVPWLILAATVLFVAQEPISRAMKAAQARNAEQRVQKSGGDQDPDDPRGRRLIVVMGYQLLVAVYGGFFGAGIGILQLAALGFLGMTNIHRMNAVKNVTSAGINFVASITFILGRRVLWPIALLMAICAIVGGYNGAGLAKRVGQKRVRQTVVWIGFGIAALMFYRQLHGGM